MAAGQKINVVAGARFRSEQYRLWVVDDMYELVYTSEHRRMKDGVLVHPAGKPKLTLSQRLAAFDLPLHGGEAMATGPMGTKPDRGLKSLPRVRRDTMAPWLSLMHWAFDGTETLFLESFRAPP